MRLALISALLVSCTNVDGKFLSHEPGPLDQQQVVFDLCQDKSTEVSRLLNLVNVDFNMTTFSLDDNLDTYAYYDPNELMIYYNFVEPTLRNSICVHELWHAVLDQTNWVLNSKNKHLVVIEDYISNYNSKFNDLDSLLHNSDMQLMSLSQLQGLDDTTVDKINVTIERYNQLKKIFATELSNPLEFNLNKEVKYSLQSFFYATSEALDHLASALKVEVPYPEVSDLVQLASYYKTFESRYFVDVSFDEIIPQLLTVLVVNSDFPVGHINVLNGNSLNLLQDLKIEGFDLAPYIQRYREAHKL